MSKSQFSCRYKDTVLKLRICELKSACDKLRRVTNDLRSEQECSKSISEQLAITKQELLSKDNEIKVVLGFGV